MATAAERLQALDDLIDARIAGGAVSRFVWNGKDVAHESLESLLKIREVLASAEAMDARSGQSDFLLSKFGGGL